MKVLEIYFVKMDGSVYMQMDKLYECENNRWMIEYQILQNEWSTAIDEITEEKARELLNKPTWKD